MKNKKSPRFRRTNMELESGLSPKEAKRLRKTPTTTNNSGEVNPELQLTKNPVKTPNSLNHKEDELQINDV